MNLESRVESLEITVAELRRVLVPLGQFPMDWKLSPAEARLLAAMTRTGEMSIDAAQIACGLEGQQSSREVVRQHISRLREKMRRRSIQIGTVHGAGYMLNEYSLEQVRKAYRLGPV